MSGLSRNKSPRKASVLVHVRIKAQQISMQIKSVNTCQNQSITNIHANQEHKYMSKS